ncbi:hypothetical protein BP6252_03737 [Coleophoma cylindrospora]|uniref:AB hydrolase-1 domain-containing protein n=1 Tax=Coleophoma cylindrospora TaxID=1849047 RepID=A0A3D8S8E5_9HELO|nr:hypothetical protein BP6252_03737 [Coleophoma cylindrospora]
MGDSSLKPRIREGKVSIGTHQLYLSIHGPHRMPGEPIVVIIPGVMCSMKQWAAVRRLLEEEKKSVPFLLYERSGHNESEDSPNPPTAVNIAKELNALLKAVEVEPPYVLVCHSFGGIIAREFIHLKQTNGEDGDISGIVFVDANQEKNIQLWPNPEFGPDIGKGIDYWEMATKDLRALTAEEWKDVMESQSTERSQRTQAAELQNYPDSVRALADRKQLGREPPLLGSRPVSVLRGDTLRDERLMYNLGVAAGNGTEEQRAMYRKKLGTFEELDVSFQREHLLLSTNSHFVQAKNSGHNVQLQEPMLIVEEIGWVLQELDRAKTQ